MMSSTSPPWLDMAPLEGMKFIARKIASKKKRRFKQHGFNLDLSYITPRIIAMGFPSEGAESIYRNAASEVLNFLTMFHESHYKVFNLCAERTYDPAKLGGNVEWIPFADHNPAPTEIMFHFCERVYDWLVADPNNVIAVHCKAGKGRTGLMICAYLLYSRECADPVTAIQYYGEKRTKNGKHAGSVTNLVREGKFTTFFFSEVRILGDVKVMVYDSRSSKPIFYFWFNTAFVDGNLFTLASKSELDKPSKSLDDDTQVRVYFSARMLQKLSREEAVVENEGKGIEHLAKQLSAMNKVSSSMLK